MRIRIVHAAWVIVLSVVAAVPGAASDEVAANVVFLNGDRARGDVVGFYRHGIRVQETGTLRDMLWIDVLQVMVDKPVTLELQSGDRVSGVVNGIADGTHLVVDSPILGTLRVPMKALLPAPRLPAQDGEEEKKGPLKPTEWNGHVNFNGAITAGNSDTFTASLEALLQRDWTHDHVEFGAYAIYATANGEDTANRFGVRAGWKHFYTNHFYSYLDGNAERDEIQEIDIRALINVGAGYRVWNKSDKEFFDIEGGLGYRHEAYVDGTDARNDATARAALLYKDIFFEKLEFSQALEFILPVNDPDAWLARSKTVAALPVTDSWFLRAAIALTYNNAAAAGAREFDLLATLGIEYRF